MLVVVKVFGSGGDIVVVMVVVVLVMVVGYCGAVFVVVAVTHVIGLIESDSFTIYLVYSYWRWCGGDIVVVVTAFLRVERSDGRATAQKISDFLQNLEICMRKLQKYVF